MSPLEGKKAFAFSLEGNDGNTHSLEDYKGKAILLFFYPKDNTPGCTKEACGFRDVYEDLKRFGIIIFGVSKDSIPSHKKFSSDHNLPFILLSDPDKAMMKNYEA